MLIPNSLFSLMTCFVAFLQHLLRNLFLRHQQLLQKIQLSVEYHVAVCNGQVKSDTGIESWSAFCSKVFGDKYPKVECNRI